MPPPPIMTALLTIICMALSPSAALANDLRFIVLGDLPYTDEQTRRFDSEIAPALAKSDVPFVIHYGDFKGGRVACSNERMAASLESIFSLHKKVIFTPGDNDWTDCDRKSTKAPVSERLMLEQLRGALKSRFARQKDVEPVLSHQPGFPENALWSSAGVVFVTVHMVGTNNGRDKIKLDDKKQALLAVQVRDMANGRWLKLAHERAVKEHARAIIVTSHTDPTSNKRGGPCDAETAKCDGYLYIKQTVKEIAAAWGKPMLYIHGSTDAYCLDKTFGGDTAPGLWRLNGPGDYWVKGLISGGVFDAAEITFHPQSKDRPFSVQTVLKGLMPDDGC